MNLDNVVIVLDRPGESRNIGAVCRAMANCGIHALRIVGTEKCSIDSEAVYRLAIHAGYIFDKASYYTSIAEATTDCCLAAGTTRRAGRKRKGTLLLPEELVQIVGNATDSAGDNAKAAIIFGNEQAGLTDEEIESCDFGVTIPSSAEFGSFNLSHAVQIICYELFRSGIVPHPNGRKTVSRSEAGQIVDCILDDLQQIGFFSYSGRDTMGELWSEILSRAALSRDEALLVQKTFDRAASMITHTPLNHPSAVHAGNNPKQETESPDIAAAYRIDR
jgi:tRNA/rRNA methyltransferase